MMAGNIGAIFAHFAPFIDRPAEIDQITLLLANPECRLLTLVGVGGSGKTRLAVEIAVRQQANFAHGVTWVGLQSVQASSFLASTIGDAIGISFAGQEEPAAQLLHYLRDKQLLLILDNLEHLLDGVPLLNDILQAAPQVKLLVTSREALKLQQEWLIQIHGMPFPASQATENLNDYGAIRLFVERARRVRSDFHLGDEQASVVRICQLVEGLPLAVEIAASWTQTLRCAMIAAEIQRNLDFLTTRLRDLPDRHRSMQAVFEQSWSRLTDEQQGAFKRLSVFRGGFDLRAAQDVCQASLPILSALVHKCLLGVTGAGRYHIHELVRQFAEDKLDEKERAFVRDLHCAHFSRYLEVRQEAVNNEKQLQVVADVAAELENIRAAWQWAVRFVKTDEIRQLLTTYYYYCQFQSRYLEGAEALGNAIERLDDREQDNQTLAVLADLLVSRGWLCIRLGRFEEAKSQLEQSLAIFRERHVPLAPSMGSNPLSALSILAVTTGDYPKAVELGREALQVSQDLKDMQKMAFAAYALANGTAAQGKYREAREYARQACAFARAGNNRWFLAYCLNTLGSAARSEGDQAEAEHCFQSSYAIRREFDDPEGMAVALYQLGEVALDQGQYEEAQRLYRSSLDLYQGINDQGGLAAALHGLGRAAAALQDYAEASQYLDGALHIATQIRFLPLALSILISAGELLLDTGRDEKGLECLAFVLRHAASNQEAKDRVLGLVARHRQVLPNLQGARYLRGDFDEIEALNAELRVELAQTREISHVARTRRAAEKGPANKALVEPLTPRELEVLDLLAQGLSNPKIAEKLVVSVGTVKAHTGSIYAKLGAANRVQAVSRARELGLV